MLARAKKVDACPTKMGDVCGKLGSGKDRAASWGDVAGSRRAALAMPGGATEIMVAAYVLGIGTRVLEGGWGTSGV